MNAATVHVRFLGMLSSGRAEALVRACAGGLDALFREIACWEVSLQPPRASWGAGGYAVRAQARLNDGSILSIRAQGSDLEDAVQEAFDGLGELLQDTDALAAAGAWRPSQAAALPGCGC